MNVTNALILTVLLTVGGKWSANKKIDIRLFAGGLVYGLGLMVLAEANEKFANLFATLVLVGVAFMYVPPIAKKVGLTK